METIERTKWGKAEYVGVYLSPRGFANEGSCYLACAGDPEAVARLQALVDAERIPGSTTDGRIAYWMATRALQEHLGSCGGCVLTIDANGVDDVIEV